MPDFFKYCPNCKSTKISKSADKNFHCPDCLFVYYHNVAAACALFIEFEDKILFTVRKFDPAKNKLDLPGGFVDYNESVESALKREIKEELNLEINRADFIASFPNQYIFKDINYHTLDLIFRTQLNSMEGIRVNDDVKDYCLLKRNEIDIDEIGLDSVKKAVSLYLNKY